MPSGASSVSVLAAAALAAMSVSESRGVVITDEELSSVPMRSGTTGRRSVAGGGARPAPAGSS